MVAEILNNTTNLPIWNISFISIFCLSCVVFLGLKLKWFRAQLRFSDDSTHGEPTPVQGVGFRMKTNPEDFQSYKSTSEFTTPLIQNHTRNKQNGQSSSTQNNTNIIKIKEKSANTNIATINKLYSKPQNNINVTNKTQAEETNSKPKKQSQEKPKTVNFDPHPIEITNSNIQKYEQPPEYPKIKAPSKNPLANQSLISVESEEDWKPKSKSVNFDPQPVEIISPNPQNYEQPPDLPKTKPPPRTLLSSQVDWQMKIVDETSKKEEVDNSYIMANNYSSAASIFFGGSAEPVQPRPRKFVEMDDNVSEGSETCA